MEKGEEWMSEWVILHPYPESASQGNTVEMFSESVSESANESSSGEHSADV